MCAFGCGNCRSGWPPANGAAVFVAYEANTQKAAIYRIRFIVDFGDIAEAREERMNLADGGERVKTGDDNSSWRAWSNRGLRIIRILFKQIG